MGAAYIIFKQTIVMFLYMITGYTLYRTGKIQKQGSKDIATLLVQLVIPAVIINSFCTSFTEGKLNDLLISSILGAVGLLISIIIARFLCHANPIDEFAAAFSNAGFIGIPLVSAAYGSEAVFYIVGMTAMLNILQWTYGVFILTHSNHSIKPRAIIFNPIVIGTFLGLIVFLSGSGSSLPSTVADTVKGISALNAPLAMIVLGIYLAQTDIISLFKSLGLYKLCIIRLLLIPAVILLAFKFFPCDQNIKYAIIIASSAPVGVNVAVYAQLHGLDYSYACKTVTLSTLISVLTLPAVIGISAFIL